MMTDTMKNIKRNNNYSLFHCEKLSERSLESTLEPCEFGHDRFKNGSCIDIDGGME